MNETDLRDLAHDMPDRLAVPCRPVDQVIARGTSVRRRRRALRAAGVAPLAAVLAVAIGSLGDGDRPDVRSDTAQQVPAPPPPSPTPPGFLPLPGSCGNRDEVQLMAEQVDPAVRVLPTWLPPGFNLLDAHATAYDPCSFGGPSMALARFQDDTVTASVSITGPYTAPPSGPPGEPTPIRGTTGTRWEGTRDTAGLHLEWTEPGGGWWTVNGRGVDEPTLRSVVESLGLSTTPGSPPATLPPGSVPPGYEVLWQAQHVPALDDAPALEEWGVAVGRLPDRGDGTRDCTIGYTRDVIPIPAAALRASPGAVRTDVGGQVAVWDPETSELAWNDATDATLKGFVSCRAGVDLATIRRIAESLEPVETDDPRLGELLR